VITEIHLFDFDGTLFRSPEPPPGYPDGDEWWPNPASMKPPHVPEKPGASYWIKESVQGLRKAIARPRAFTAVLTARMYPLRERITELLDQQGLHPDDVILNESDHRASGYKIAEMTYLTRQIPTANVIHFWEDKVADLKGFQRYAERRLGKGFVPHLIRATRMPSLVTMSAGRVASRWLDR